NAPLLILTGEKDDWTPAPYCRRLVDEAKRADASTPLEIDVYPNALHSFDGGLDYYPFPNATNINNCPGYRGASTAGDAKATRAAIERVRAFFGRWLQ
ncbi:MAG: dienelactone hydrolase family protein, partial [Burkholderiales bacterium]